MKKILCFLLLTQLGYGQVWRPMGHRFITNYVADFLTFNNQLYSSGTYYADSSNLNNISRWDGTDWQPLANGMVGGVYTLTNYNNELYIAGGFLNIDTIQNTRKIARWDGATFHALAKGITSGFQVNVMLSYNSNLYVGGSFQAVDSLPIHTIAKWDGVVWSPVCNITGTFAEVESMAIYNGDLYIGGYFTGINGRPMRNIARFDGTSWSAVGDGLSSDVYALVVDSATNRLYAAGNFTSTGTGAIVFPSNVAYWDGVVWTPVGSGPSLSPTSLTMYKNQLYTGGHFSGNNNAINNYGDTLNFICKWDGNDWQPLGKGVNTSIQALYVFNNDLIVGGGITMAGDSVVNLVAAYTDTTASVREINILQQEIKITPNPTKNSIAVTSPVAVTAYSITSPTGQIIKKQNQKLLKEFSVDTSALPGGLYIFTATMGKQSVSIKFAKE
ncbi:MAG TPA: T9SS type A sorting domain-containing protein [Bacteroidia bacterium]|nr:T9SS type A sorting domain-containing protein [Bacteroidia bacterium]